MKFTKYFELMPYILLEKQQQLLHLRRTTPEAKGKLEAQAYVTPIFQTPKVRDLD